MAFDEIDIDLSQCSWFDADMCASLGAILYNLGNDINTVSIVKVPSAIENALSKNGFLQNYGRTNLPDDIWNTTIRYQRFDVSDGKFFGAYVQSGLMRRSELPNMSAALKKKLCESVFEIFHNAVTHSRTELGIFCCGQFFPGKHCIDFCIADLGIGIRRNIEITTGKTFSAGEAIQWATEGQNTTKSGPIPGGLGLKLLREFIGHNGGQIQIVSEDGHWSQSGKNNPSIRRLAAPFPGTAVNIEINTADQNNYILASEVSSEDIF